MCTISSPQGIKHLLYICEVYAMHNIHPQQCKVVHPSLHSMILYALTQPFKNHAKLLISRVHNIVGGECLTSTA